MDNMPRHVVIDGNNLLHAMHAYAPIPQIGRETLVRIIERWAERDDAKVSLIFDGAVPDRGLARQMASRRLSVRFSSPVTADDVIVDIIQRARDPGALRVVTSDNAIRHEAGIRRCQSTDSASFVRELFPSSNKGHRAKPHPAKPERSEKPGDLSAGEVQDWLDTFGVEGSEPFDGHEAMNH